MHPYTRIASNVLFPLHERLKGHNSLRRRRELERTQWWSSDRLEHLRSERLRGFLMRIGDRVPYYRRLFAELRFAPSRLGSVAELAALPFLTKALIREHTEALKADGAQGLSRFNTGGSSGEPLIFYLDNARISHDVAAKWRATRWWGVDVGDPEIVLWGSPIELRSQDRLRDLRDRLLRTELLPAFQMSAKRVQGFLETIRRRRPAMLFGYPSAFALLARHARGQGLVMDDLGIRVAFVTAERLYDEQRTLIESVFGCPVANGYGGRDAGFIAHQCPAGGMHISAEDIIVEVCAPDGRVLPAGEAGEVVITHLATGAFPFVRYRTGDIAVRDDGACACGRGLPMLREVQGRATDFVVARDGTVMHGLALIYVLRDRPGIEAFKIIQEDLETTRVQLKAGPAFDAAAEAEVRAELQARLGAGVRVPIERVQLIPPEASGKYRYVISKLAG